jgi:methylated-DNA-[protein]-cysteine S-methyltransferase
MYARDHAGIATPIGIVRIEGDDARLNAISIGDYPLAPGKAVAVRMAVEQIGQWFAGARRDFDLPLTPMSTSRGEVLRAAMVGIGYGETLSYGALARLTASSPRAIGQLCSRNPFPIVVPCHRVLAGGGKLGNYSGGDGPKTKSWLLDHERRISGGSLL